MRKYDTQVQRKLNSLGQAPLGKNFAYHSLQRISQLALPTISKTQNLRLLSAKIPKKRIQNSQEVTTQLQSHNPVLLNQSETVLNLEKRTDKIRRQLIEQNINQNNAQTLISQCYFCGEKKQKDLIFLPCGHQFHAECLKLLMDNQVNQQSAIIRCQCGKKIPQQFCVQYLSPFQLKIYFQIQAQLLPKLNQERRKWKKCTNHGCDYIFIEDPRLNINVKKSKCPNCIEQIQGKTMLFPKSKYL